MKLKMIKKIVEELLKDNMQVCLINHEGYSMTNSFREIVQLLISAVIYLALSVKRSVVCRSLCLVNQLM